MTAYATLQEVYDLGLTAQAFTVFPRALDTRKGDTLDPITGTFRLSGHGYTADDVVEFVLAASGALPAGAALNTSYHPLPLDYWRFRLAASQGGPALTFADVGTVSTGAQGGNGGSAWGLVADPERRLARVAEAISRDIDQDLVAHSTPIVVDPITGKFPDKLVGIVARCTARRSIAGLTFENAAYKAAAERLIAEEKRDDEQRARWRGGQPLLPTPIDQTPTAADDSGLARARFRDPHRITPWLSRGSL